MSKLYTFKIESLSHEGRGIAHYGTHAEHPIEKHGKKVFIRYALVGETVQARLTQEAKRFDEADSLQVLAHASSSRISPFCPHYGECGGCSLQHLDLAKQVEFKQQTLSSHLKHFAHLEPIEWADPIIHQGSGYRRRTRIGVRYVAKTRQFLFGFRKAQCNDLVEIEQCPILDHALNLHLPALKQCLAQLQAKADIGHIELAKGDHTTALVIRQTAPFPSSDMERLVKFCQQLNWQLYVQAPHQKVITPIQTTSHDVALTYHLDAFDITLSFLPTDFTQVNHLVNAQMVQQACRWLNLKSGERVLDLFCGLGNFSLPLARLVGSTGCVVGVEGSADMVKRAKENAQLNGLTQTQFFSQDLSRDFSKKAWAKQGFDAILIDPPRAGAELVMSYLANFKAQRIVYVSCNPATLARDSKILASQGYRLKKAGIMDMFSHTGHVESMALFERVEEIQAVINV